MRALIEKGADVNTENNNGETPLHVSATNGHLEVVRALLEKGADVNAKEDNGWTPLHYCAREGHLEVARFLIKAGSIGFAKFHRELLGTVLLLFIIITRSSIISISKFR